MTQHSSDYLFTTIRIQFPPSGTRNSGFQEWLCQASHLTFGNYNEFASYERTESCILFRTMLLNNLPQTKMKTILCAFCVGLGASESFHSGWNKFVFLSTEKNIEHVNSCV